MDSYSHWDLMGAILAGVIGGGIVAVLGQLLAAWLRRPNVVLSVGTASQVDTPYRSGSEQTRARYLRLKVENNGRTAAHGCKVFARRIEKTAANGSKIVIVEDDWFDLSWAYGRVVDGTSFAMDLPRGAKRYADVCFSVEAGPMRGLHIASNNFPIRLEEGFQMPGTFSVTVVVAGDDFEPSEHTITFQYDGSWGSLRII